MGGMMKSFASDNYSGVHPDVLAAISAVNDAHAPAYGYDETTTALETLIKDAFGTHATCYPVFNGTGANIIALQAILPRHGAVLAAVNAHIHNDESIAPEMVAGTRVIGVPTHDGKLRPELIAPYLHKSEHNAQVKAVYISQVTELGTCYSLAELHALKAECTKHGLYLYMDGARLSNAAAHLNCTLKELGDCVDMLSFGGTKNGLMIGELLVVLNPALNAPMKHLRKINMQLGSKMRFISAQFVVWLKTGLWQALAKHSNAMATDLYHKIKDLDGVEVIYEVASNAVFVALPEAVIAPLQESYPFYVWDESFNDGETPVVRLMASFDTTPEDVDGFVTRLKALL